MVGHMGHTKYEFESKGKFWCPGGWGTLSAPGAPRNKKAPRRGLSCGLAAIWQEVFACLLFTIIP